MRIDKQIYIFINHQNYKVMKRIDYREHLNNARLRSRLAEIEDKLIENFDYSERRSFAEFEEKERGLEVYYDAISDNVVVLVHGVDDRHPYPNVERLLAATIDTCRIDNEVRCTEYEDDWNYEAEMDNRRHQDRMDGYGYGIFW